MWLKQKKSHVRLQREKNWRLEKKGIMEVPKDQTNDNNVSSLSYILGSVRYHNHYLILVSQQSYEKLMNPVLHDTESAVHAFPPFHNLNNK